MDTSFNKANFNLFIYRARAAGEDEEEDEVLFDFIK